MKITIEGGVCDGFILRNEIVKVLRSQGKSSVTDSQDNKYIITVVDEEENQPACYRCRVNLHKFHEDE